MSGESTTREKRASLRGPLAWMAQNAVAANLLMLLFIVGGILLAPRIKQEVFPEVELDVINITVPYPGASPQEVEQGVVLAVEEAIRGVDGVKEVRSSARESVGMVSAELMGGARGPTVLNDIQSAVDRITSLPREAERPVVALATRRQEVMSLVLYGDTDERSLRLLAEQVRDDLLSSPGITLVELGGVRPPEISVEVPRENLRRYNLTLDQVAQAVSRASIDLPAGGIKSERGEVLLRTRERREEGADFADIVVLSQPDGTTVRLSDIGRVVDGFREVDQESSFNGKRAVQVRVFRVGTQTPLEIADTVHAYVKSHADKLPPGVQLGVWNDMSETFRDRIDLLRRNALLGLVLVLVTLGIFLNIKLAFWVTMGIPISFLGAMLLMPALGVSINMISLFAFILALGIVVDDAIVVGEAVYKRRTEGLGHLEAAIAGVRDVAVPVVFSVLTTIIAFMPLLFVPGTSGAFFKVIPLIVIPILAISLIESLLILPAHLGHGTPPRRRGFLGAVAAGQEAFSQGFERLIKRFYVPAARAVLRMRYLTVAVGIALLLVTMGYMNSGRLKFTFMPRIEGDIVTANLALPFGANPDDTRKVMAELVKTAGEVVEELGDGKPLSRGVYAELGSTRSGGGMRASSSSSGAHTANISVRLVPLGERTVTTGDFVRKWREKTGELAGVDTLTFNFSTGPQAGAPVNVELTHINPEVLETAAMELARHLGSYAGVFDIENGIADGKEQLDLKLTPQGRSLGLTESDLARQVRSNFFGAEASRQQRGRDELRIFVRLPLQERSSEYYLESLMIRLPSGGEMPLAEAAAMERGRSYTEIRRRDGKRILPVTSDVDTTLTTGNQVVSDLQKNFLPALMASYPGLRYDLAGEQQAQAESLGALRVGALMALLAMFGLMAVAFKSYVQPLIILVAIPFGLVGAIWGHVLLGYDLSLMSVMGMVALSGVVVNDSIVLISAVNEYRARGIGVGDALVTAGTRRFRPILLTSLTTFFGLFPMILEKSVQARFLVPMAVSLGFGVLFVTLIALMLVPSMYFIIEDIRGVLARLWRRQETPEDVWREAA